MSESKDKFTLKKITTFEEIRASGAIELPTSDLCLTDDKGIYQFEYQEAEEVVKKIDVNPGVYTIVRTAYGVDLQATQLNLANLLEKINNTAQIINQVYTFFNKLAVYEELGIAKKRSVLLYSDPGFGKTSAINKTIDKLMKEDPGTVALIWPTSEINAEMVGKLLSFAADYKGCTRMVLVAEDIGGNEEEGSYRPREVNSSLLNLLDGVNVVFRIPTFIIATTNYPQNLLSALADRPGRFDELVRLPNLSMEERIDLASFIAKRELTEEERDALALEAASRLSIAHIKELVVRSRLHDKTFSQIVKEMNEHTEQFKGGFEKKSKLGLGFQ